MKNKYLVKANSVEYKTKIDNAIKELESKLGNSEKALITASSIIINDYLFAQPDVVDLPSLMFDQAEVNGSTMTVKTGYMTGNAIVHAIGTSAPVQTTYAKELKYKMERISWKTAFDVSELKNEFLQKVLNNASEIDKKISLARLKIAIELIKSAITNDGESIYGKSASLQASTLKSLLRQITDKSDGKTPKAIVGRYSLVSQICDFTGFGPATLEKIDNEGFLGRFHGAAVIAVNESNEVFVDSVGNKIEMPVVDEKGIFIVGGKCGYEGKTGIQTYDYMNFDIPAQCHHTYQDYAAAIIDKRRIGFYEIG